MRTGSYNIDIYQGESFSLGIIAKNSDGSRMDLSGYSVRSSIKYRYSNISGVAAFSGEIPTPESGNVFLSMHSTGTAALPVSQLIYDVEAYSTGDGSVTKLLRGYLNVYPEITYA